MVQNYLLYRELIDAYLNFNLPFQLGVSFIELVSDLCGIQAFLNDCVDGILDCLILFMLGNLHRSQLLVLQKSVLSEHCHTTSKQKHNADHRLLFDHSRFKRSVHRLLFFPAHLRQLSLLLLQCCSIGTGQCLEITRD
jgi:hypothetical protein